MEPYLEIGVLKEMIELNEVSRMGITPILSVSLQAMEISTETHTEG